MKPCSLKVNGGNWRTHVKWSKPGSVRQRQHAFSHMGEIDTIPIQAILWKTGYIKGQSLMVEEG
jgi:hypothetical protein